MPQSKVVVNRVFNCSSSDLFNWLIQPELLAQWFGPRQLKVGEVSVDLRVGGELSVELIKPMGDRFLIKGLYTRIEAPNLLVYDYGYEGLESAPPDSTVTIKINDLGIGKCELNLTQEINQAADEMSDREAAWNGMFNHLEELIK